MTAQKESVSREQAEKLIKEIKSLSVEQKQTVVGFVLGIKAGRKIEQSVGSEEGQQEGEKK